MYGFSTIWRKMYGFGFFLKREPFRVTVIFIFFGASLPNVLKQKKIKKKRKTKEKEDTMRRKRLKPCSLLFSRRDA